MTNLRETADQPEALQVSDKAPATPTTVPRSFWRSFAWWLSYSVAWLAVVVLLAFILLRIFYHDGTNWLTWFNAFTRYLYLPAWVCLAWAAWQRRWILCAAAAAIVACHIAWLAPDVLPDRRFAGSSPDAGASNVSRSVRIFFANVHQENHEHVSLFREIAKADPDIIVFAEFNWHWLKAIRKSSLGMEYPHGASQQPYPSSVMVMSRLPLKNDMRKWVCDRPVQTVDVDLNGQTLRLIGLHAPRPMYLRQYDYAGFWKQMVPSLIAERGPLVVVGDFNATQHSLVYQQLRAAGLRSAHDDRGRGYATTWPNRTSWIPPIRIDQAMLSPEIECERIFEGLGSGSDHKPLILDFRIRQ